MTSAGLWIVLGEVSTAVIMSRQGTDRLLRRCRVTTALGREVQMTTTLLAPSVRLANEAIAKRIVAKVRDHSPAPGLLTLDRWELAEIEIRLALDAAGRGRNPDRPTAAS